jgi:Ni/Fe-hydrogenase subunit HybB-like protein
VLMLDLGRSDRVMVAITHFNFKSIFAWTVFLYSGFFAIVGAYLWLMMERRLNAYAKSIGVAAFIWRLLLTTGTGSIFGFLIAREAYQSALLAPLFIALSLAYGTALYLIVLVAAAAGSGRPLGDAILARLKNLLATFVAASLYFVVIFHLTNLYFTRNHGVEQFILINGGSITALFWLGQVMLGCVVPLILLLAPGATRQRIIIASIAIVIGGLIQMYVTIIGGQAWPLDLFPGYTARSSFFDGVVHGYRASVWEVLLGSAGCALAIAIVMLACKLLRLLPERMDDATLDLAIVPTTQTVEQQ